MKKMTTLDKLNHENQPELCFHRLLDGKGRLSIIRSLAKFGKLRYTEFQQTIADISPRILSLQLRELEGFGIIEKTDFNEYPKHTEYRLSSFGQSMIPIIDAIADWYAAE